MKTKIKGWLKRYLPPEIIGTITAVSSATIAHSLDYNLVVAAYAGSIGEAIGFYATVIVQNFLFIKRQNKVDNKRFAFSDVIRLTKSMLLEFGPAGILDGLVLRPFFMILFPVLLHDFTLGILVGKIAGDITFYVLVILSHEIKTWSENKTTR